MKNKKAIRWPSPAKLNLFLYINGQRDDGYHELQTLFQFIDRSDFLTIETNNSNKITISPIIENLALEDNLIYKAAMILKEFAPANVGAHIHLEKILPMGGGLGGGSSNAATTLVALNYQWELNLSSAKLAEMGVKLGADVPIFILGKSSIAEGVGELLIPVIPKENHYIIGVPDTHVSTMKVFQSKGLKRDTKKESHEQLMSQNWINDCETYVKKYDPKVAKIIDCLLQYAPTRLTGTGACVFSTFESFEEASSVMNKLPTWLNAFLARGLNNSPLQHFLYSLQKQN